MYVLRCISPLLYGNRIENTVPNAAVVWYSLELGTAMTVVTPSSSCAPNVAKSLCIAAAGKLI
jgi:hypothetical protein